MTRKKKQPDPDLITLENQIDPTWQFRLSLSEADVRRLNDGTVPDWLQRTCAFWVRDNPKPSDIDPQYRTIQQEAAEAERKSA